MFITHTALVGAPAFWLFFMYKGGLLIFVLLFLFPITVPLVNLLNSPLERAINNWYISDAKRILRGMPRLMVIGVTGSYGKTSTKNFLQRLLLNKFNALMTPESFNTPMGVVKTIRTQLKPIHDVFICEMGARNIGDIKELCDIVKPRYGVITAVGPQHLETFKTIENVEKTKFELADAVASDGGVVFLNYDSEIIRKKNKNYDVPLVSYGVSSEAGSCSYTVGDVKVSSAGSSFCVTFPDGEKRVLETPLIGKHNVQNIVGAIAVADYLGVERDDIVISVRRLEAVPHRLQLIKKNSIIIIDDAYNANPNGARAALETLGMFDGVKIMITPGMIELGDAQDECNKQFGAEAAGVCDYVILVGEKQTKSVLEGLKSASYPDEKIFVAETLTSALDVIEKMEKIDSDGRQKGRQKIVLLENDLPDNY